MNWLEETIVAAATPPGRGGMAVIRLSGPRAVELFQAISGVEVELAPRRASFVRLQLAGRSGEICDEAVVTWFEEGASYTGESVVEVATHGSPVVVATVVGCAISHGARLARPGEFTLRAFVNGRLDLTQAEAVRDLVEATTERQVRVAYDQLRGTLGGRIIGLAERLFGLEGRLEASVDFPEEGYHFADAAEVTCEVGEVMGVVHRLLGDGRRGRAVREGVSVVIVGRPNVGKSALFNQLVGRDRAIVTAVPGTTRDVLSEKVELGGYAVDLADTAGVRAVEEVGVVEREGIARAWKAREGADVVLVVVDGSKPVERGWEDAVGADRERVIVVVNKGDLGLDGTWVEALTEWRDACVEVSALCGWGLSELESAVVGRIEAGGGSSEEPALSNARHVARLGEASEALERCVASLGSGEAGLPEELVLADLRLARGALEEVVGRRTDEELLESIFGQFCIGK